MEIQQKKHNSSDSFSFPSTPSSTEQDCEFEFGSITPDKNSPADHLFFNGRLLPHRFPIPTPPQPAINYNNAITWRSASSKESLVSSRSNSTNSRSSCSSTSSARTSSSDGSERGSYNKPLYRSSSRRRAGPVAHVYGSSQRWQFMAAPVLSRESSTSSRRNRKAGQVVGCNKQGKVGADGGGRRRFGWRILGWLMMACRECHAMEPIKRRD